MNAEFIKNAIDAFKDFVAACGNDVATAEGEEYCVFNGQVAVDHKGNVKTYAISFDSEGNGGKILVAQVPLRPILNNAANLGKTLVDLYEDSKKKSEEKAQEENMAAAEAAEAENKEIDSKISDLESQISSLKASKRPVRRLVKRQSFEDFASHNDNTL